MFVIVATVKGEEVSAITATDKTTGIARMKAILGKLVDYAEIRAV